MARTTAQATAEPKGWGKVISSVLMQPTIIKVAQVGAGRPFYFLVTAIDPTRKGGDFAWVQGKRVTAAGKPVDQISHLHCPEGERKEFLHIDRVSLGSAAAIKALDTMNLGELRAYAVAQGFSTVTKLPKARMLAALKKAQADT